jgi:hypothetical protein
MRASQLLFKDGTAGSRFDLPVLCFVRHAYNGFPF